MFSLSAHLYDLIYQAKNYAAEADALRKLLSEVHPQAKTILDVACGTGEHAKWLAVHHGFQVDGTDINPEFVEIAAQKCPQGKFTVADMAEFDLHKTYDVIICLFGSIGYVLSLNALTKTLQCFARHLNADGVIIFEPWFTPADWTTGKVYASLIEKDDLKVCRMNSTSTDGRISLVHLHYMVGSENEVHYFSEDHKLLLSTHAELEACLHQAKLKFTYRSERLQETDKRGLYIASHA